MPHNPIVIFKALILDLIQGNLWISQDRTDLFIASHMGVFRKFNLGVLHLKRFSLRVLGFAVAELAGVCFRVLGFRWFRF